MQDVKTPLVFASVIAWFYHRVGMMWAKEWVKLN
jgi:hypothetical protein